MMRILRNHFLGWLITMVLMTLGLIGHAQQIDAPKVQTPKSSASSSLLDDLLTDRSSDRTQKSPKPDAANEPVPLLSSGAAKFDLSEIIRQMQSAALQLDATSRESQTAAAVAGALNAQQIAIDELDRLISQGVARQNSASVGNEVKQAQTNADSEEANRQSMDANKNDRGSPSTGNENSEKPSTENQSDERKSESKDNPGSSTASEDSLKPQGNNDQQVTGLPTGETIVDLLKSIDSKGGANWGKLPERLREQLANPGAVEFPVGYEEKVRDYYRQLNRAMMKKP